MSPHSQETQKKLRQDTNKSIKKREIEGKRERVQIEATRDKSHKIQTLASIEKTEKETKKRKDTNGSNVR